MINEIVRRILKWRRLPQIERFMKYPHETQERLLLKLLNQARDTEWGKKYQYTALSSHHAYQQKVPISAYEDIAPYIERMMLGEQNILWGTPIEWFSKSSGTTNARSKFIPVSPESLRNTHFRGGNDIFALYVNNNPKTRFFRGRGLSIGGTFQTNPENPKIKFGDISAVVVQNLPKWAQDLRSHDGYMGRKNRSNDCTYLEARYYEPLGCAYLDCSAAAKIIRNYRQTIY
jgi:hypothetical protein